MNLLAVVDILDKMHERMCRIESAVEQGQGRSICLGFNLKKDLREAVKLNDAKLPGAKIENEKLKTVKLDSESNDAEWAQILSHTINERIKVIISKTYTKKPGYPLTEKECLSIIRDLINTVIKQEIRPEMKREFGSKLKLCLVSIFRNEDWARGDHRETHKYVGYTWNALKELELW